MWLGRTYRSLGSGATRRPSRGASAASALFAWFLRGRRNSTVNESRTFDIGIGIIRSLRYTAAVSSFFCLPAENQRKTEKKKKKGREGQLTIRRKFADQSAGQVGNLFPSCEGRWGSSRQRSETGKSAGCERGAGEDRQREKEGVRPALTSVHSPVVAFLLGPKRSASPLVVIPARMQL